MPKIKKQGREKVEIPSIKTPKQEVKASSNDSKQNIEAEVKIRTEEYNKGVKDGIEIAKNQLVKLIKKDAFNAGIRQLMEVAENKLAEHLGLKSRQELATHGDLIPSWWIASYFSPIWYGESPVSSETVKEQQLTQGQTTHTKK